MRKFILTSCVTLLFVIFIVYSRASLKPESAALMQTPAGSSGQPSATSTAPPQAQTTPSQNTSGTANSNPPTPAQAQPTAQLVPAATATGQYKDGSYTGPVTDAYFGNLQVQAVISGGKLADVVFLQYPQDRHTSDQINQQALPQLKQEAISAQSANVNIVSGATQTSTAFQQSLAAALLAAKN